MNHKKYSILLLFVVFTQNVMSKSVMLPDFTELVEKTANTVVNISARQNGEEKLSNNGQRPNNPFERYFGIPQNPQGPQERDSVSGGSGFIISEDGYILTNRHVIHGADEITVRLSDRREFDAELIGEDEASDIALLKVTASKLPKLEIGDVEKIKIGEWVMAIGSPLSFEQTVTKGIISAKGRPLGGQQYIPYLQSDVPINRGNSGGPLINMDGEVVGINTLILSNTGGYMGLSFSIPIDVAMSVVEQLKLGGTVKRGLLGVNIQPVTQKMADYLGLDKPQGALVTNVNKGSSAEKAGIQVQDVIVEFDGKHVETSASLPPLVGAVKPGSIVDLTLVRDGKTKIIKATLDGLKGDEAIAANDDVSVSKLELGFEISDLNDNEMQELDVNQGVYVKDIKKRSVLRSGLTIGSVILELGKTPVKSVKHFKKMLDDLKEGEPIVLLVKQGGGNSYIVIERE